MRSFKNFIVSEEVDLQAICSDGIDVNDHAVRDNINCFLSQAVTHCSVTPYIALHKVSKVLANFNIFIPKPPHMHGKTGVHIFHLRQFNEMTGMRNDGSIVTKTEYPYHLFFKWECNDHGFYDIHAEIVTAEELSDRMEDEKDEDLNEAKNSPEESFDRMTITNPKWRDKAKNVTKTFGKKIKDAVKANKTSGSYGNDPYDSDKERLEESPNPNAKANQRAEIEAMLAKWKKKKSNKKKVGDTVIAKGASRGVSGKNLRKKDLTKDKARFVGK